MNTMYIPSLFPDYEVCYTNAPLCSQQNFYRRQQPSDKDQSTNKKKQIDRFKIGEIDCF
jgi:hypothetical protein